MGLEVVLVVIDIKNKNKNGIFKKENSCFGATIIYLESFIHGSSTMSKTVMGLKYHVIRSSV